MQLPNEISVALKEWSVVCQAIETGRQILLLRKGGISESVGGFELEHRRFVFFPTFVHQRAEMLKPEARIDLEVRSSEPEKVEIRLAGEVSDIVQVKSRQKIQILGAQHIWSEALIDMRFNYKPHNPLYLLLVRGYRLSEPILLQNTPAYAGCKSWVPLESGLSTEGAETVLNDSAYEMRRRAILEPPILLDKS